MRQNRFAGSDLSYNQGALRHFPRVLHGETEELVQEVELESSVEEVLGDVVDVQFAFVLENAGISRHKSALKLLSSSLWSLFL